MPKVSIILPTYNERENIKELIGAILQYAPHLLEIIVVDDNSPDGTWKIVEELGKKNKKIRLLRRIKIRGLVSAIIDGIKMAKGDVILWMDCDFSHPPELIPKLLENINHYDVSLASRYVAGGKDFRDVLSKTASRLFNSFAVFFLGASIHDYTSGFLAAKSEVFKAVGIPAGGYGEYFVGFIYNTKKKGFKIKEVPFTAVQRKAGCSKTALRNIKNLLRHMVFYGLAVIKARFR